MQLKTQSVLGAMIECAWRSPNSNILVIILCSLGSTNDALVPNSMACEISSSVMVGVLGFFPRQKKNCISGKTEHFYKRGSND